MLVFQQKEITQSDVLKSGAIHIEYRCAFVSGVLCYHGMSIKYSEGAAERRDRLQTKFKSYKKGKVTFLLT